MNDIDLLELLNHQYLCETLTVKEIRILLEYTELVEYDRDATIADVGEIGNQLYFIIGGEVGLFHAENNRETEIGRLLEGEMIGEMSFFDKEPRLLSMRAGSKGARLLCLTRPMYERIRIEHPYIAVNILEHAIISLDRLFRRVSTDEVNLTRYIFGKGKR